MALALYEAWLVSNASTISTIESSLRSLTWFLPGRFKDAELASEAMSATLNLLSLYHDTLLARRSKAQPILPPSSHSRYTHAWADKSSRYKWVARTLEIIKYLELLFEMSLRRGFKATQKTIWRAIICVEFVKTVLRFTILRLTRRPTISPPIPEREIDPADLQSEVTAPSPPLHASSDPSHLRNNNDQLPTPTSSRDPSPLLKSKATLQPIDDFLLPKALSVSDIRPPQNLVRPVSSLTDGLSEAIFILRPLVYVIALSRAKPRSSSPLIISLSFELLSHYLRRHPPPSFSVERQEYARRDRSLLWYFLRGSVWQDFTRPKLEGIASLTQRVPLVNVLGALVNDWMPLIDQYYYYSAT